MTPARKKALAAIAVAVAFVAALVLWSGTSPGDSDTIDKVALSPAPGSGAPVPSGQASPGSGSASPSGSGQAGGSRTDLLPGFPFPESSDVATLPPGTYSVTLTGTSDKPIGAVGYVLRGQSKGTKLYNVRSPFTLTRTVSGSQPYAAIGVAVAADGTEGECTISINGKVMVHREVHEGYAVAVCVA